MENEQLDNVMDYSGGAQFQNDDDLELALGFVREQNEFMQVNTHSQSFYLLLFELFF